MQEPHSRWAQRLARYPDLVDVRPLIEHMLAHGIRLEQEAAI